MAGLCSLSGGWFSFPLVTEVPQAPAGGGLFKTLARLRPAPLGRGRPKKRHLFVCGWCLGWAATEHTSNAVDYLEKPYPERVVTRDLKSWNLYFWCYSEASNFLPLKLKPVTVKLKASKLFSFHGF